MREDMVSEAQVSGALREVLDPELGINIVDLGLVYSIDVDGGKVRVTMTMTTRACPLHVYLTDEAHAAIQRHAPEAVAVDIDMVWDPPWTPAMMSAAAKEQLGWSA